MAEQLTFDLPLRPALGRDAFFVTAANALALRRIDGWRDWPGGRLILTGPPGSGKTHLAHVWAAESGARVCAEIPGAAAFDDGALVIEDADRLLGSQEAEEALFHLLNRAAETGASLLMTARDAPGRWRVGLRDLESRLLASDTVALAPPDDALLSALLVKLFADRQIRIEPELVPYLVARMERSASAARALVAALDAAALKAGRRVNRRLAREVLAGQ